jgi:ATP-binding cassette subfamily F protein 3
MWTCTALEGALNDFPGTILCVSHDRYFLDKVATRMIVIDPPNITDFEGGYSAWQAKKAERAAAANAAKGKQKSKRRRHHRRRRSSRSSRRRTRRTIPTPGPSAG